MHVAHTKRNQDSIINVLVAKGTVHTRFPNGVLEYPDAIDPEELGPITTDLVRVTHAHFPTVDTSPFIAFYNAVMENEQEGRFRVSNSYREVLSKIELASETADFLNGMNLDEFEVGEQLDGRLEDQFDQCVAILQRIKVISAGDYELRPPYLGILIRGARVTRRGYKEEVHLTQAEVNAVYELWDAESEGVKFQDLMKALNVEELNLRQHVDSAARKLDQLGLHIHKSGGTWTLLEKSSTTA